MWPALLLQSTQCIGDWLTDVAGTIGAERVVYGDWFTDVAGTIAAEDTLYRDWFTDVAGTVAAEHMVCRDWLTDVASTIAAFLFKIGQLHFLMYKKHDYGSVCVRHVAQWLTGSLVSLRFSFFLVLHSLCSVCLTACNNFQASACLGC